MDGANAASTEKPPASPSPTVPNTFLYRIWTGLVLPPVVRRGFIDAELENRRGAKEDAQKEIEKRHYQLMLRDLQASNLLSRQQQTQLNMQIEQDRQGQGQRQLQHTPSDSHVLDVSPVEWHEHDKRDANTAPTNKDTHDSNATAAAVRERRPGSTASAVQQQQQQNVAFPVPYPGATLPQSAATRLQQQHEIDQLANHFDDAPSDEELEKKFQPTRNQLWLATGTFLRRLLAEFSAAFLLNFALIGLAIENALGHVDRTGQAVADGLVLMVVVYGLGGISGAHANPLVTLAFVLRRANPFVWLPFYWLSQFAGATVAAAVLQAFYNSSAASGSSTIAPGYTTTTAFLYEMVLTMFLIATVLLTATRGAVMGAQAALPVGGVLGFAIMIGGSVTGASLNWWRTYAPAMVNGGQGQSDLWVYFVGQLLGTLAAVALTWTLTGTPTKDEKSGAQGAGRAGK